jgi:hypothetical protein
VAAAVGSNSAAGYQLATQAPVMAIGGFNGSDPSPTLAQFRRWVAEGRIHYFIAGAAVWAAASRVDPAAPARTGAPRPGSPAGWSRRTPPGPSTASRSTTSPPPHTGSP